MSLGLGPFQQGMVGSSVIDARNVVERSTLLNPPFFVSRRSKVDLNHGYGPQKY
jgi:hypothetical protein